MTLVRVVPRLALAALLVAATGCAGVLRSWSVAPNGLIRPDDQLRRDLAAARYDEALERVRPDGDAAPDDELLRLLYEGVAAHFAGRYAESADALDRAAALADDRYTRSVSRGALSLISSDRTLEFRPSRTERLLIHYYGALGYLHQADPEGAAVEARRLSALLQAYDDDGWDCEGTRLCSAMRYFAGAVFEAAGFYNDARVAYRNAGPLAERLTPAADDSATGEVLVLLERGFVAHRVEEAVTVLLTGDELYGLESGDEDERAALSTLIAARVLGEEFGPERSDIVAARAATARRGRAPSCDREDRDDDEDDEEDRDDDGSDCYDPNPYLLRIAWPSYRDDYEPYGRAVILGPDDRRADVSNLVDISEAVMGEFADARLGIVARAVARAAAKYATVRTVESSVTDDEDDTIGRLLGLLTNLGGALLEKADTRSWHVLPDAIGVARMRLPPGRHTLELALHDSPRGSPRRITVGPVEVRKGATTFVSARVWQ